MADEVIEATEQVDLSCLYLIQIEKWQAKRCASALVSITGLYWMEYHNFGIRVISKSIIPQYFGIIWKK